MGKLFYKGKPITSEEAHALDVNEKAFLTGRKPILESKVVKDKPLKKKEKKHGTR